MQQHQESVGEGSRNVVEAMRFFGEVYGHTPEDAEVWLREAFTLAQQAGDGAQAAEIAASLVRLLGYRGARFHEALVWAERGESQLDGDAAAQRATLACARATVHSRSGDYESALRALQAALELRTAALGPEHRLVGSTLRKLAGTLRKLGLLDECDELLARAERILLRCGQPHDLAELRFSQALSQLDRDQPEAVLVRLQEARALWAAELGPESAEVASADNVLAEALAELGRVDEARAAARRARAVFERRCGEGHPAAASSDVALGLVELAAGDVDAAEAALYRAVGLLEAHYDADHPDLCRALHGLAEACRRRKGPLEVAARLYRRALEIPQRALGPLHPCAAANLAGLAEVALLDGELEQALALAGRAEDLLLRGHTRAATTARVRFTLAQALVRRDPARAAALARSAEAELARLGERAAFDRAVVTAWLAGVSRRAQA